jgi:CRISP-associated protein Cas1
MRRTTSISPAVAHLIGPGKIKIVNGYLAFSAQGQSPLRLDPAHLKTLLCYGDVSVTGSALELLFAHHVQTAWLSPMGHRCRGRLAQSDPPTTLTRVRQHAAFARSDMRLAWARLIVAGKIEGLTLAARHYQRHGADAGSTLTKLADAANAVPQAGSADELRGLEGSAAVAWFRLLGQLLKPPWVFEARTRRPPTDPVNALLSLGYTWLLSRAIARSEAAGCEIYLGGLHEYRAGRPSLACDLIEPLRVTAVDRWLISVCNRRELTPDDFRPDEEHGGVRLKPPAFGTTLRSWELYWTSHRQDLLLETWLNRLLQFLQQSAPDPDPASGGEATAL